MREGYAMPLSDVCRLSPTGAVQTADSFHQRVLLPCRLVSLENTIMTDNLKDRGPQDRSRISLEQEHEVRYWSKKFQCTEEELRAAVGRVGASATLVEQLLHQSHKLTGAQRAPL